ncbi:MAG: hypothetical protein JHD15_25710 [Phenylobacterium sp.]|jgi:hypothetical protein|uniref:hypothetical protein n=1 Tax=Phenylobacterium sp. TaxID=1871053 RepID=UPI001A229F7B|nr:hypothetical protein [Phenylobacterium sp.]MBJ7413726.1 hypothetical protein [Phenylobacterium sp.]
MKRPQGLARIFAAPGAIAALSLFGLVAALIGDGPWDWAGWIGLAAPLAALGWAMRRRG